MRITYVPPSDTASLWREASCLRMVFLAGAAAHLLSILWAAVTIVAVAPVAVMLSVAITFACVAVAAVLALKALAPAAPVIVSTAQEPEATANPLVEGFDGLPTTAATRMVEVPMGGNDNSSRPRAQTMPLAWRPAASVRQGHSFGWVDELQAPLLTPDAPRNILPPPPQATLRENVDWLEDVVGRLKRARRIP